MAQVSEPLNELVGGGKNEKYVKDCTELYLGGKGIEKIRSFERLVNLEVLWLNDNKLKYINNLDRNFRIKVLHAENNKICSLKGSLSKFKFLGELDLSGNELRNLEKLLLTLERFCFLTHLNLQGNPCCEELDYRLHVIHRVPSLRVLDNHVITPLERIEARKLIGGDVAANSVAFGKRAPAFDPAWVEKVPERSHHEVLAVTHAAELREQRRLEQLATESHVPDLFPPADTSGSLPPPPGWAAFARPAADAAATKAVQQAGATLERLPYRPLDIYSFVAVEKSVDEILQDVDADISTLPAWKRGDIKLHRQAYQEFRVKQGLQGPWQLKEHCLKI